MVEVLHHQKISKRTGQRKAIYTRSASGSNNHTARATRTGLTGSPQTFTASAASDQVDYYEVITPQAALATGQDFILNMQ